MSTANKWKIKKVKFEEVKPWDENPRKISEKAVEGLRESLSRFGYVEPIVFNERTGNIVGGHQRFKVLVEEGIESAMMMVVDMTLEAERAANITLNNPEIEGHFVDPALQLAEMIEDKSPELFKSLNFDGLKADLEKKLMKTPDDPPPSEEPEEPSDDTKCPCCGYSWKISVSEISSTNPGEGDV